MYSNHHNAYLSLMYFQINALMALDVSITSAATSNSRSFTHVSLMCCSNMYRLEMLTLFSMLKASVSRLNGFNVWTNISIVHCVSHDGDNFPYFLSKYSTWQHVVSFWMVDLFRTHVDKRNLKFEPQPPQYKMKDIQIKTKCIIATRPIWLSYSTTLHIYKYTYLWLWKFMYAYIYIKLYKNLNNFI